jgi:hypothetical protein
MKTNIIIITLIILVTAACKTPGYLSSSDQIDINEYGSYIKLFRETADPVMGELIAIDSTEAVVLTAAENRCIVVPMKDIVKFKLRYASSKHYGWTIPLLAVLPLMNGLFAILTMPFHLIVTVSVTASGERAFQYSNKNMTYDMMTMFARFPQGIPPGIEISSIKRYEKVIPVSSNN